MCDIQRKKEQHCVEIKLECAHRIIWLCAHPDEVLLMGRRFSVVVTALFFGTACPPLLAQDQILHGLLCCVKTQPSSRTGCLMHWILLRQYNLVYTVFGSQKVGLWFLVADLYICSMISFCCCKWLNVLFFLNGLYCSQSLNLPVFLKMFSLELHPCWNCSHPSDFVLLSPQ